MTDEERGALKAVMAVWFFVCPLWLLWMFPAKEMELFVNPLGYFGGLAFWFLPVAAGAALIAKDTEKKQRVLALKKARAYQEAAHGVVAYRLGHDVGDMAIGMNRRGLGSTLPQQGAGDGFSTTRERLLFLFAGAIAERELDPYCDLRKSDTQSCMAMALELVKQDRELNSGMAVNRLLDETKDLVRANWRQISAVATALLEDGALAEGEWKAILRALD